MVSIVIPIYNEEELIVLLNEAIAKALIGVCEEWEVIYVNDGSTDSSLELLKKIQSVDSHVVIAELSRNWGHMGAIHAGIQAARGKAVILMDGDFQDPPQVLPQLLDAWRRGAEVVVGVRRSRQESRKLLAFLFPLFYRLLGALSDYPIPLNAGIFSLWTAKQSTPSLHSARRIAIFRGCAPGSGTEMPLSTMTGKIGRAEMASFHSSAE